MLRSQIQLGVSADELLQDELDFGFIAEATLFPKAGGVVEGRSEADFRDHELSDCTGWRKVGIRVSFFSGKEIASDWRNDRSRQELTGI